MANVLHRTTLEYKTSVNTPNFPVETWIINPDLTSVSGIPNKYWKISGDNVLSMNSSEMASVDQFFNTQSGTQFKSTILNIIAPDPFAGVSGTVSVSGGLNLVTNIPNLIFNDVTTVSSDPSFTKNVRISVVYSTVSGTFGVVAREKTTDNFSELLDKELLTKDLAEFFVVANGSTLTPV